MHWLLCHASPTLHPRLTSTPALVSQASVPGLSDCSATPPCLPCTPSAPPPSTFVASRILWPRFACPARPRAPRKAQPLAWSPGPTSEGRLPSVGLRSRRAAVATVTVQQGVARRSATTRASCRQMPRPTRAWTGTCNPMRPWPRAGRAPWGAWQRSWCRNEGCGTRTPMRVQVSRRTFHVAHRSGLMQHCLPPRRSTPGRGRQARTPVAQRAVVMHVQQPSLQRPPGLPRRRPRAGEGGPRGPPAAPSKAPSLRCCWPGTRRRRQATQARRRRWDAPWPSWPPAARRAR